MAGLRTQVMPSTGRAQLHLMMSMAAMMRAVSDAVYAGFLNTLEAEYHRIAPGEDGMETAIDEAVRMTGVPSVLDGLMEFQGGVDWIDEGEEKEVEAEFQQGCSTAKRSRERSEASPEVPLKRARTDKESERSGTPRSGPPSDSGSDGEEKDAEGEGDPEVSEDVGKGKEKA